MFRADIRLLLADAQAGRFDMVLSEALNRISGDQEDVATVFKRLRSAGCVSAWNIGSDSYLMIWQWKLRWLSERNQHHGDQVSSVIPDPGRRTARLDTVVHHLGWLWEGGPQQPLPNA